MTLYCIADGQFGDMCQYFCAFESMTYLREKMRYMQKDLLMTVLFNLETSLQIMVLIKLIVAYSHN